MDTVEDFEHCGKRVRIYHDEDPMSPRDWDNLGRMVCWHSRYRLGDQGSKDRHPSDEDGTEFGSPDDFRRWWEKNGGQCGVILPLYLYDHSGITMSCAPFSCPWDSGQVGYIYATRERLLKEYGGKRLTAAKRELAKKCLMQEVETYDEFFTGQVYGYVVGEPGADEYDGDSCLGFYGLDYCIAEAKSAADAIARRQRTELADAIMDAINHTGE